MYERCLTVGCLQGRAGAVVLDVITQRRLSIIGCEHEGHLTALFNTVEVSRSRDAELLTVDLLT